MSQDQPVGTPGSRGTKPASNSGWVSGGVTFAAVLMLCTGVIGALQGIAAIAEDDVYGRVGDYVYKINLTGWGWIHLILGVLVAATGAGLFTAAAWARYTGIFLASISIILQFMFLPYAPVWSVVVIAIDVFIIWALASYHGNGSRSAVA
ncbi:hypothetical protein [Streptomyces sp. NBC_00829]|uniref:DUF7144 family membrane protein n=1 Tax=Streptomyces sp. NBC_00829 TaxID=2903679 RepID=UPI00386A2CAD|nr:hypothetical protein OG293_16290 [Streptomyces sp. NBC_00829]